MEIQIDPHTLERADERGTNEEEIKDVIKTGFTIPGWGMVVWGEPKSMISTRKDTVSFMNKRELKCSILLKAVLS